MARVKKSYSINVHYPESEEGLLNLRKNMAEAYLKFVEDYILALPVCAEQKNKLYSEILELLCKQQNE
jgi:hypothetical protein